MTFFCHTSLIYSTLTTVDFAWDLLNYSMTLRHPHTSNFEGVQGFNFLFPAQQFSVPENGGGGGTQAEVVCLILEMQESSTLSEVAQHPQSNTRTNTPLRRIYMNQHAARKLNIQMTPNYQVLKWVIRADGFVWVMRFHTMINDRPCSFG